MIFSDSVTQQFSDPHSIGFKAPDPEFQKLTLWTRDILFLPHGSAFPSCRIQLFITCRVLASFPVLPPSSHLPRFEFSLPPPPLQRLAWPKALIAKLVYIGEINALQMRLNTFSKKMQTVRVRIITQVGGGGGGISVAQSCRARVKPADTVRLIHFSGEREEDLAFAC